MKIQTLLLVASMSIAPALASADMTFVCGDTVSRDTRTSDAEIALTVASGSHRTWTLERDGQKFKGRKWIRTSDSGYEVRVQGTYPKTQMVYAFTADSVEVTLVADGVSRVLEHRACFQTVD